MVDDAKFGFALHRDGQRCVQIHRMSNCGRKEADLFVRAADYEDFSECERIEFLIQLMYVVDLRFSL